MKSKRAYDSPLRAEHAAHTRQRILSAVTEAMADPAAEEITIPVVALRARVSLRTVYRHFPTRDALFDEWAEWVDERLKLHVHSYPDDPDELAASLPGLFESFDESECLMQALLSSKAAGSLRTRTRRLRQRPFLRAMAGLMRDLTPQGRSRVNAVIYLLVSARAWQGMREQWGLDGREAGWAASWAVRVLMHELRRDPHGIERISGEARPQSDPLPSEKAAWLKSKPAANRGLSPKGERRDSPTDPSSPSETRGGMSDRRGRQVK